MTAYTNDVPVQSPLLDIGDDVYAKPQPIDTDWLTDNVLGEPVVGFKTWNLQAAGLDYAVSYIVFKNAHKPQVTTYNGTDTLTVVGHGITADGRIYCSGANIPANIVAGKPYYLVADTADTFKLSLTSGGAAIADLGSVTGTLNMFVTATEKRSASDEQLGALGADEAVLVGEGQATRADAQFADILARLVTVQAKTDLIGTLRSLIRW